MKFFFNSKKQGNFKLAPSDFKTETNNAVVKSVWISPELLNILPKQPTDSNKETSIEVKSSRVAVELFQTSVEISFDPDEIKQNLDEFVQKINKRLDWLSSNKILVDEIIIRDLLELKNSNWLQQEETPLKKDIFLNKIKLTSITFFDDISSELSFDDGDIFAGHTIVVSVTKDKKVESATMEG